MLRSVLNVSWGMSGFAGTTMERLWTPWRLRYVAGDVRHEGCVFCAKPAAGDDVEHLILYRGERAYLIMNLFPYNTGHVMVVPFQHAAELSELDPATNAELFGLLPWLTEAQRRVLRCDGFNIGLNLGAVAGAGISDHLHIHVVPRWQGDANFMPILANTMVLPELIPVTYAKLRAELELSDDQVRTLEALIERFRKEAETRLRAIEAAERDLAALFESEEWNLGEVEAKVRAIEKLRADLRLARIRTIAEGRAALTPEQRKKLEGIIAAGRRPPATRRSEAPEGERSRGVEEMHRFMSSARMPQAMAGMMEMARRMGDGDPMLGMVRMMEMMGAMGGADGHPRGTRGPGGVRREPAASPAAC